MKLLSAILSFVLLYPAGFAYARSEESNWRLSLELYKRGEFSKAKNLLLELARVNPKKSLYWFNLGNSYFMLKDYGRAITAFSKVEELASPLAPAATLYRAKAYKARGENEAAQALFRQLLARPGLPPALAQDASNEILQQSAAPESPLALYQAGKYKAALRALNREANPDSDQKLLKALILIKIDREDRAFEVLNSIESVPEMNAIVSTLLDRIRDNYSKPNWLFAEVAGGTDKEAVVFADAGAGLRFWAEGLWYWNGGYTFRLRNWSAYPEDNSQAHEVRSNFAREVGSDLILISPFFVSENWDSHPARNLTGASIRLRSGRPQLEYGAEIELARSSGRSAELAYLNGSTQRYALVVSSLITPFYVRGALNYEREDIGDATLGNGQLSPSAYRAWGPSAKLLWRFRPQWVAEFAAAYSFQSYPTPSQPGAIRREDRQLSSGLRLARIFSNRLTMYGSWNYERGFSSLDRNASRNENYNRTLILAGVIWDAQ